MESLYLKCLNKRLLTLNANSIDQDLKQLYINSFCDYTYSYFYDQKIKLDYDKLCEFITKIIEGVYVGETKFGGLYKIHFYDSITKMTDLIRDFFEGRQSEIDNKMLIFCPNKNFHAGEFNSPIPPNENRDNLNEPVPADTNLQKKVFVLYNNTVIFKKNKWGNKVADPTLEQNKAENRQLDSKSYGLLGNKSLESEYDDTDQENQNKIDTAQWNNSKVKQNCIQIIDSQENSSNSTDSLNPLAPNYKSKENSVYPESLRKKKDVKESQHKFADKENNNNCFSNSLANAYIYGYQMYKYFQNRNCGKLPEYVGLSKLLNIPCENNVNLFVFDDYSNSGKNLIDRILKLQKIVSDSTKVYFMYSYMNTDTIYSLIKNAGTIPQNYYIVFHTVIYNFPVFNYNYNNKNNSRFFCINDYYTTIFNFIDKNTHPFIIYKNKHNNINTWTWYQFCKLYAEIMDSVHLDVQRFLFSALQTKYDFFKLDNIFQFYMPVCHVFKDYQKIDKQIEKNIFLIGKIDKKYYIEYIKKYE